MQRMYAPERLQYPLRRVEGTARGEGQWERVSWDDAISEIAEKWRGYLDEYGPGAVARCSIYGSYGHLNGLASIAWTRLQKVIGMSTLSNGADMALIYTAQSFAGSLSMGSDGPALVNSVRNIIIWGSNPVETLPHEWRYLVQAQQRGAVVTVIDARISPTACKADKVVTVRPASDPALTCGVCKCLIDNDLIDVGFLLEQSVAPCLVQEDGTFLRQPDGEFSVWSESEGRVVPASQAQDPALKGDYLHEGKVVRTAFDLLVERVSEWTLERTAKVCDCSEDDIVWIARAFADGPTTTMVGNGAAHYTNSHALFTGTFTATILSGNLFKPGAGWGQTGLAGDATWFPGTSYASPENAITAPTYSILDLPEIMETGSYLGKQAPIKSVLFHAGNPLGNTPNRQAMIKALESVELLVAVDMSMTDTARYADIVLPCVHWFESEDVGNKAYLPYARMGEQAVDPQFEQKTDFEIARMIGRAMGEEKAFEESENEVLVHAVDTSTPADVDGNKITYERLKAEKNIRVVADGYYDTKCKTKEGRLLFYWEKPRPRIAGKTIDEELERMVYFEPPGEAWPEDVEGYGRNALAEKYPLIFMSLHTRFTTHTTYNHADWLVEIRPNPHVFINPSDAKSRGIEDGDLVKVFNDRGYVVVEAYYDGGMRPGMVSVPHGWEGDQFVEGHYQDLTSNISHPFDDNECYYDCLCEVEKFEGGDQ
ncbi:MAG TPA: molybdopterin-dependent oxidoreductase [Candidatus Rubneribacter avistercoris]|nr:molybdopterin-dependent oxidoreductase [Candidatus Rubneribacter avistercoris]